MFVGSELQHSPKNCCFIVEWNISHQIWDLINDTLGLIFFFLEGK